MFGRISSNTFDGKFGRLDQTLEDQAYVPFSCCSITGQHLCTDLLYSPLVVLTYTFRTAPSWPGKTSEILPISHFPLGALLSTRKTTSMRSCLVLERHFAHFMRVVRFSRIKRFQKCLTSI